MLSTSNARPRPSPVRLSVGLISLLLAGCASVGGMPDPSVQYPIAGLPPPPYAVREERLQRPDPEANPEAARGYVGSQPPQWAAQDSPVGDDSGGEQESLPPPPTFNSLADCERAYGPGQCRTGDELFSRHAPAGIPVPAPLARSYMPEAYGSMTGALAYGYLAPPSAYVPGLPYQQYVSPIVISRYQVITPVVIQRYRSTPIYVREAQIRRGPVIPPQYRRPIPLEGRPPHARPPMPPIPPRQAIPAAAPPPATLVVPQREIRPYGPPPREARPVTTPPREASPGTTPPREPRPSVAPPRDARPHAPQPRDPTPLVRPAGPVAPASSSAPVARPTDPAHSGGRPPPRDPRRKEDPQRP